MNRAKLEKDGSLKTTDTEYRGYVKNLETGKYEGIFTTNWSAMLAKTRSIEEASLTAQHTGKKYDTTDVIVKKRTVTITYGDWEEYKEEL